MRWAVHQYFDNTDGGGIVNAFVSVLTRHGTRNADLPMPGMFVMV